jgi:hypothetical protein
MNMKLSLPLASFGFFNSRGSISFDQIRCESLDEQIRKMEEGTADFNRAVEQAPSGGDDESFGEKLKQAVKRKLGARGFSAAATSGGNESFGEKIKKAVEQRSGRKRHKEQAERERNRYPQPRPRTKGE